MYKKKLDYSIWILEKVVAESSDMEEEVRQLLIKSHIDEVKRLINLTIIEEEDNIK